MRHQSLNRHTNLGRVIDDILPDAYIKSIYTSQYNSNYVIVVLYKEEAIEIEVPFDIVNDESQYIKHITEQLQIEKLLRG